MEKLQFSVRGFTGLDFWCSMIYTHRRMAKRAARKMIREGGPFFGYEPSPDVQMILSMPDAAYRIIDLDGNVEKWTGEVRGVGA